MCYGAPTIRISIASIPGVLKEVRGAIGKLPETTQRNILTDNAIRFYKL